MSRSIAEIYDAIVAEKQTLSTLDGLMDNSSSTATSSYKRLLNDTSSSSKVAVWRLWIFIVAVAIWVHESLWDEFRTEIDERAKKAISGNIAWYLNQIYNFQYNYDLSFIDGRFQYPTADEDAKIIKRAAIVETNSGLRVKVSKVDNNGRPIPLEDLEYNAFKAYINKVKIAGTNLLVISDNADKIRFDIDAYYNPLIGFENVKKATEDAISTYLANLDYNGALVITRFTDSIQKATGIEDVYINSIQSQYGDFAFTNVVRQYIPNAGFIEITGGLPLSSQVVLNNNAIETTNDASVKITYIPNV